MSSLTLDWLHIIALLGAIHGVFLAAALAAKRRNRTANRLLAVTMLAFSIYMATGVYHAAGLINTFPHFFGLAYPLPFVFGPLVYLYALSVGDRARRLTWRDALHFLPVVVLVVAAFPIYLKSGAEKVAFFEGLERGEVPLLLAIADPLKLVSGVIYTAATIRFLRQHRERVKESYSSVERVNLRWLLWLVACAATIWMLAVAFQLLDSAGVVHVARNDDFIALGLAVLVYSAGYLGLRQPEVFRFETAEHRVPVELLRQSTQPAHLTSPAPVLPSTPAGSSEPATEATTPRYEHSGLTDEEAERLEAELLAVMEKEQPWRDSELTLADLAERLSTTPHKLSEVLNAQVGQTFYDFVNGYRVREVQRRIAAGEARKVTMLALALDAGFASKSTFNEVFKKHTSQTPSGYRQAVGL